MQTFRQQGLVLTVAFAAAIVLGLFHRLPGAAAEAAPERAPEFTSSRAEDWINSEPLRIADLEGSVVLLDVWTFDCWNCYRSIPWLKTLEERYGDKGFRIVGIHTPEFRHERVRANVEDKVREFGITHPVMMDNDFEYWKALNNRYWPSFYLVDKRGRIRGLFVGETHAETKRALRVEGAIETLLAEG